jgi:hypothetical protein
MLHFVARINNFVTFPFLLIAAIILIAATTRRSVDDHLLEWNPRKHHSEHGIETRLSWPLADEAHRISIKKVAPTMRLRQRK